MSTKIESQESSTPTPTAEETEMNRLRLEQFRQTVNPQTQLQLQGMDLVRQLFAGSTELPGFFGQMGAGISPTAIGTQAAELTRQNMPGFQMLGLGNSGVAYKETARDIANQLLFPAEQFNFGAKQNLMNLALGGQAQVQQPITANTSSLGAQLAGLRSVSGTSTTTRNPFLESFYGSLGKGLGQGVAAAPFAMMCWVAKEIFGSWEHPKTIKARFYIQVLAPKWFRNFYIKYGERIANFIHNKPVLKWVLRPLFEHFALVGERHLEVNYV